MSGFDFLGDDASAEQQQESDSAMNADVDELMTEAERRFAKAKYWESKIRNAGFEGDDSPMAVEVTNEARSFYRQKMAACLGLGPDAAVETPAGGVPFTPEIIEVLKQLGTIGPEGVQIVKQVVSKFLNKPALQKEMLPSNEPMVRRSPSPRNAPSPKAKPPAPPVAAPKKPQQTAAAPVAKKAAPQEPSSDDNMVIETPTRDGGIMRRSYQKMTDPELGTIWLGENGNRYVLAQNEAGQNYMKSVQRQAKPVGVNPHPPLTGDMMMAIAGRHVAKARSQETPGHPDQVV